MIGLINHDPDGRGKLADKRLQIAPGSKGRGGIVRVADIYQSGGRAHPREHAVEVVREFRGEVHADNFGINGLRVLLERFERWQSLYHLAAVSEKGASRDAKYFRGAASHEHLLGPHMVEVCDPLYHVVVLPEGIPVCLAGRGGYGVGHDGRRTVDILVAVQTDRYVRLPLPGGLGRVGCRNFSQRQAEGCSCGSSTNTQRAKKIPSRLNHAGLLQPLTAKDIASSVSYANTSASRKATPTLSFAETIGASASCQSIFRVASFHAIVRSAAGS